MDILEVIFVLVDNLVAQTSSTARSCMLKRAFLFFITWPSPWKREYYHGRRFVVRCVLQSATRLPNNKATAQPGNPLVAMEKWRNGTCLLVNGVEPQHERLSSAPFPNTTLGKLLGPFKATRKAEPQERSRQSCSQWRPEDQDSSPRRHFLQQMAAKWNEIGDGIQWKKGPLFSHQRVPPRRSLEFLKKF